ncbi:MAG: hypothetical protein IBJ10_01875 [Phycisphaerales bacterium]|nr:hypothetical protein [Phycisphaerales bacterium]
MHTSRLRVDPLAALRAATEAAGTDIVCGASLSIGPDFGYAAALRWETPDREVVVQRRKAIVEEVAASFVPGRSLGVNLLSSPALEATVNAIRNAIPPEVLGDLGFVGYYCVVGAHDIFDRGLGVGHPVWLARAQWSFGLSVNSTPAHGARCREVILEVPAVRALRRGLEGTVGPLQVSVAW